MNTNTTVQTFTNENLGAVRTVEIESIIWFVAVDVTTILGYSNSRDAIKKHVDDEDKNTVAICDGIAGNPNTTVINESGLYSLILSSKMPKAKEFKRWVTSEVLPAIRERGFYSILEPNEPDGDRPTKITTSYEYLEIAKTIARCKTERLSLVIAILRKGGYDIPDTRTMVEDGITDTSDIADRLREVMDKYHLSQKALGELMGVSRQEVYRYLSREHYPRPAKYVKMINTLERIMESYTDS